MPPSSEEIRQERKAYDSVRKFKTAFAAFGQKAETGKFNGEDLKEHLR
jgi:hypothetical protein